MASCAPQTNPLSMPVDIPPRFSASGSQALDDRWWTAFADPDLNHLVTTALAANPDLAVVWYRLHAAQALAARESALLLPTLDGEAEGEVSRQNDSDSQRLFLGLTAGYELDLWGRIASATAAERYRARATREEYRAATLSLAAEVAINWYRLLEARQQRSLLEAQIATNDKVLQSIEARFAGGLVRSVDVLRQRQLLEATREQKFAVEARIGTLEHLQAVLLGRPPGSTVRDAQGRLPVLPPLPATGIPLHLVQRRPDVRSAFYRLQAADADLAAAISDRFPRLTLAAGLGTAEEEAEDLFDDWLATLGANLLAPIFDGGRRQAEIERRSAQRSQQLFAYAQSTLDAFREVEDALVRERKQAAGLNSLEKQVALARQSYRHLRYEYFNGVNNYLEVLTALTEEQRLQRDLLAAHRELLEFRIALYRALAGPVETAGTNPQTSPAKAVEPLAAAAGPSG